MFISCLRPEDALPVSVFNYTKCIQVANLGPRCNTVGHLCKFFEISVSYLGAP